MVGGRCNVVDELLDELARLGITLVASDDRLRYHPRELVAPELVERLKEHKAEVLEIVNNPCPADRLELEPCGKCGGLELWKNLIDRWRCLKCEPSETLNTK